MLQVVLLLVCGFFFTWVNSLSQRSGHLITTTLNSLTCNILKVLWLLWQTPTTMVWTKCLLMMPPLFLWLSFYRIAVDSGLFFLFYVRSGFKAAFFPDDNKVESQSIFIPVQKLFPGLYNPVHWTDWHRAPSGAAPHPPVKTAPVWQKEGGVSTDNDISVLNLQQEQSCLIQSLLILATSWI